MRTAWVDRGINDYPVATFTDGRQYFQELGLDDAASSPAVAINAHGSGQIDLADGEQFAFIRRLIDITFENSTAASPNVVFTTKVRDFPGGNYDSEDAATVTDLQLPLWEQFYKSGTFTSEGA